MQTVKFARQRAVRRLRGGGYVYRYSVSARAASIKNPMHWVVRAGAAV